jgi:hypothetical protein
MREPRTGSRKKWRRDRERISIALNRDLSSIESVRSRLSQATWSGPWQEIERQKELDTNQESRRCTPSRCRFPAAWCWGFEALRSSSCPILDAALEMAVETSSLLQSLTRLARVKFRGTNINGKDRPAVLVLLQVLLPPPPAPGLLLLLQSCSSLRQMQHQVKSSSRIKRRTTPSQRIITQGSQWQRSPTQPAVGGAVSACSSACSSAVLLSFVQ